jgi:hypothetical protein
LEREREEVEPEEADWPAETGNESERGGT